MDLKAKILAARKKLEPIEIPEWDFPVYVRRMTSADREVFDAETKKTDTNWVREQRLMIFLCLCNENGEMVFQNPDELKDIDSSILDKLSAAINKLSGVTKEKQDEIKKKLESEENSGSNSTSQQNSASQAANI